MAMFMILLITKELKDAVQRRH